jgi:hypothetical protein
VKSISRIGLVFKAVFELGLKQVGLFGLYKLGLKSGYFRWRTPPIKPGRKGSVSQFYPLIPVLDLPDPKQIMEVIGEEGYSRLIEGADEIVSGQVRLFGGNPVPLELSPTGCDSHWTAYEGGTINSGNQAEIIDIKFIWEPARFGWAFTLARAYFLSGDEVYPESFWKYFEDFQESNPVNMGPNWASAQEAALRIVAFTFASQVFSTSSHSTPDRKERLAQSVADHAVRILPTLVYARAQNNNHLLSESVGLITAWYCLPEHPKAKIWGKRGWKWFNRGLETQIGDDGTYNQHSTNYHRLVLQLALWVHGLRNTGADQKKYQTNIGVISPQATKKIEAAVIWLMALFDPESGKVPNLGPHDGAHIIPLSQHRIDDYRPVLQAAGMVFMGEPFLEPGTWDEEYMWLKHYQQWSGAGSWRGVPRESNSILRGNHAWAYLRGARFTGRPGHADQLHLDLWWRGLNIAQDAGTYLYNAAPPWNNALMHTAVHNTVMVNRQEQMERAGKFLYLDWAQAEIGKRTCGDDGSWERITAQHNGYRKLGLNHARYVTVHQDGRWVVEDIIHPVVEGGMMCIHEIRLHWLLPDWDFKLLENDSGVRIRSPFGWIAQEINALQGEPLKSTPINYVIARAGELLQGSGDVLPVTGWVSPTYSEKVPALSLSATVNGTPPIHFTTEWRMPDA